MKMMIRHIKMMTRQNVKIFTLTMIVCVACPAFSQTRQYFSDVLPEHREAGLFAGAPDNEKVIIHFKNLSSALDINYMDNARMLAIIDRTLSDLSIADRVDYITITGSASPDGFTERNERMASERASAIKNHIAWKHPHINKDRIFTLSAGEDWDGLRQMIENDFSTPARSEAIKIIRSSQSSDSKRKQLQALSSGRTYRYLSENMFPSLRGGAACMLYLKKEAAVRAERETAFPATAKRENSKNQLWENESETTFPATAKRESNKNQLWENESETTFSTTTGRSESNNGRFLEREVEIEKEKTTVREYSESRLPAQSRNQYDNVPAQNRSQYDNTPVQGRNQYDYTPSNKRNTNVYTNIKQRQKPASVEQRPGKTVFAVKTNLLYDVVTALNFELEVPVDDSWSIAGEYIFPWWLSNERQKCFQLICGNLELRHWLGYRDNRPRLTGWYAGLFVGGGYYDFEFGDKGYQGEFYIGTGLGAGYAHQVSKNGKWRMEYALGLGYMKTKYREYTPKKGVDNEWHLLKTKNGDFGFVGPLRARVSLVYTINR